MHDGTTGIMVSPRLERVSNADQDIFPATKYVFTGWRLTFASLSKASNITNAISIYT